LFLTLDRVSAAFGFMRSKGLSSTPYFMSLRDTLLREGTFSFEVFSPQL